LSTSKFQKRLDKGEKIGIIGVKVKYFAARFAMDELLHNTLLFDFYGELLTERQREMHQAYFCDDMSLSEVGDKFGVTRQAVNIALKETRKKLDAFEEALGLVKRHEEAKRVLNRALETKSLDDVREVLLELEKLI